MKLPAHLGLPAGFSILLFQINPCAGLGRARPHLRPPHCPTKGRESPGLPVPARGRAPTSAPPGSSSRRAPLLPRPRLPLAGAAAAGNSSPEVTPKLGTRPGQRARGDPRRHRHPPRRRSGRVAPDTPGPARGRSAPTWMYAIFRGARSAPPAALLQPRRRDPPRGAAPPRAGGRPQPPAGDQRPRRRSAAAQAPRGPPGRGDGGVGAPRGRRRLRAGGIPPGPARGASASRGRNRSAAARANTDLQRARRGNSGLGTPPGRGGHGPAAAEPPAAQARPCGAAASAENARFIAVFSSQELSGTADAVRTPRFQQREGGFISSSEQS